MKNERLLKIVTAANLLITTNGIFAQDTDISADNNAVDLVLEDVESNDSVRNFANAGCGNSGCGANKSCG